VIGRLHHVIVDCPDPVALAGFYAELLGLPITWQEDDFAVVARDDKSSGIGFQLAPDFQAGTAAHGYTRTRPGILSVSYPVQAGRRPSAKRRRAVTSRNDPAHWESRLTGLTRAARGIYRPVAAVIFTPAADGVC